MLGVLKNLDYSPDVICGVSVGAILALPYAVGRLDKAIEVALKLRMKDFWDTSPFSLASLWGVIRGKDSLGSQNIGKLLGKIISPEDFHTYKTTPGMPSIFVFAVDVETGNRRYWNLKLCTYPQAIDRIAASAAINIMTSPITIEGKQFTDGGFRDHSPANVFLKHSEEGKIERITEVVSIYSRPQIPLQQVSLKGNTFSRNLLRSVYKTYNLLMMGITLDDCEKETEYCKRNNVKLTQYFLPYVLKGLYDTDHRRLKQLFLAGQAAQPVSY